VCLVNPFPIFLETAIKEVRQGVHHDWSRPSVSAAGYRSKKGDEGSSSSKGISNKCFLDGPEYVLVYGLKYVSAGHLLEPCVSVTVC